ncbi:hypothetical protein RRG08_035059 [Elysia crispata]|uniref:Uncharacterized protein n=1 Tax=Elysia crispata TaxID=231223 RepID=A0AAE1DL36_9GAST|nr:hypothetical protein RRG08_035059 [Elysia crispata]
MCPSGHLLVFNLSRRYCLPLTIAPPCPGFTIVVAPQGCDIVQLVARTQSTVGVPPTHVGGMDNRRIGELLDLFTLLLILLPIQLPHPPLAPYSFSFIIGERLRRPENY